MDKMMWAGRFEKEPHKLLNDFNSSIRIDGKMFREDILGSLAHAEMLVKQGIIPHDDGEKIMEGLNSIALDIENGILTIDPEAEDIHMFVEKILTERVGDAGKKLHTARSRNDQVALDTRLYLRKRLDELMEKLGNFALVLCEIAEKNMDAVMPGYTHLQRAQPVTFAHHLLAYAEMLVRDKERFFDCRKRLNVSPLGSCALAGTTHPIDRSYTAEKLGFSGVMRNSMDGVSDRDFCVEAAGCAAIAMMHLSRFSEEIVLWSSWEFKFLELDDAFATGSSIMPQKKNPDIAELVRGKTGRVYGNLVALLTIIKGLPLAYNKDMQEDKESIFDSLDTLSLCLEILSPMLMTARVRKDNMLKACRDGFINATDCADYLVKKGVPFRSAYKISGEIVAHCIRNGTDLESLSISEYRTFSSDFDEDVLSAVDMASCLANRTSEGAPSQGCVRNEIDALRAILQE